MIRRIMDIRVSQTVLRIGFLGGFVVGFYLGYFVLGNLVLSYFRP